MIQFKRLLTAGALAGVFGLGLFASSSFASGPLVLGPVQAPVTTTKVFVAPSMHVYQKQLLNSYRQLRTFWLSRSIVR